MQVDVLIGTWLAALLIQIATNLHNDAADFERGADCAERRLGPVRVTSQGWLSAQEVYFAAQLSFALALLCGSYLVWVGGWPIFVIGIAAITAGWAYTGGPKPIAYTGLGEFFVWLFFGVIAVAGSHYLQGGMWSGTAFAVGALIGMPAAAVLVVNNYRDRDHDRQVGKNTLAVQWGSAISRLEYTAFMLLPFLLLPGIYWIDPTYFVNTLWAFAALPWAIYLIQRFCYDPPSATLNHLLAQTAQFQLGFGLLLSSGWFVKLVY